MVVAAQGGLTGCHPPESAVALADADRAEDSLLVVPVLPQELAHYVSSQAEADHDQLGLRVGLLNVAHHGGELPRAA